MDRAEIAVASNRPGSGILKTEVRPSPGPGARILTASTANWSGEFNITKETMLHIPFEFEDGFNEIHFSSGSECPQDRVNSHGRCIKFNFHNLSIQTRILDNDTKSVFKPVNGWYAHEKTGENLTRIWMGNRSKMRLLTNNETVNFTVTSFNKPRNLTITAGDRVQEYVVEDGKSEIRINMTGRSQKISMNSKCSIPKNIMNSSDSRCLSVAVLEKIEAINYDGSVGHYKVLQQ